MRGKAGAPHRQVRDASVIGEAIRCVIVHRTKHCDPGAGARHPLLPAARSGHEGERCPAPLSIDRFRSLPGIDQLFESA